MSLARTTATVAAITLLTLGLAACQGSPSPDTTGPTTSTSTPSTEVAEPQSTQDAPEDTPEAPAASGEVPEMDREQTDADKIPSNIEFLLLPATADDTRLVGVDSAGNSWFVAQHEPGGDVCLVLGAVASGAWVVGCDAAPAVTVSGGTVSGTYDLDDTGGRQGERLGQHLTVKGL